MCHALYVPGPISTTPYMCHALHVPPCPMCVMPYTGHAVHGRTDKLTDLLTYNPVYILPSLRLETSQVKYLVEIATSSDFSINNSDFQIYILGI